jgi:serine/threonine protein kinase
MPFSPPPDDKVEAAFPKVKNLQRFAGGGFKVVYRADTAAGPEVFKLVCLPTAGNSDEEKADFRKESLGRIRREVELLAHCQRPELVKLGSVPPAHAVIDGVEYIGYTEEFLAGDTVGAIIKRGGQKPTEAEAKRLMLALLRAIEELWTQHKTIHRDIKPDNIIKIGMSDRPFVLLDLGIAFALFGTALTRDGMPCTPRYMAPEMASPTFRRDADYRTDLYTAALTVFEFSAQAHPLAKTKDDLIQTVSRALRQPPRSLKKDRPDFSDSFCATIDQMLKKKPMLRPSDLWSLIAQMEETA